MALTDKLTAIADAIRGKTETEDKLTLEQMVTAIAEIDMGNSGVEDKIIERTITEYENNRITTIGAQAFNECKLLTKINCPNVTKIENSGVYGCTKLKEVSLPTVTHIRRYAFEECDAITKIHLPNCEFLDVSVFKGCDSLTTADFNVLSEIKTTVFANCVNLESLVIRNTENLCSLGWTDTFDNTPISLGGGFIYVPKAFLNDNDSTKDYRMATNWSAFSERFRAIEDYTIDGTVTGEICVHKFSYILRGVVCNNEIVDTGPNHRYYATLEANTNLPFNVTVTMGGEDVTASVYNSASKEITIERVTGDVHIDAKIAVQDMTILTSLNSDGNSWITTDFIPDNTTVFTFVGFNEAIENRYESFFGTEGEWSCVCQYNGNESSMTVGNVTFTPPKVPCTFSMIVDNVNAVSSLNKVTKTRSSIGTCTKPLTLFSMINAGYKANSPGKFDLYYSTITQNGVLTHEYLPALDSSGTPCLYDTVQNKCWYNNGSGQFSYDL